ncbi:MAG: hypothetical protein ACP5M4_09230 [Acidobacteriaceae bacterium]
MDQRSADRLRELLESKPETESAGTNGLDGAVDAPENVAPALQPSPAFRSAESVTVGLTKAPDDVADEMAANFYGFGDWGAPYWFIGVRQGKSPGEAVDESKIVGAWANGLKKGELVDCLEYHRAIGVQTWHKEQARLQSNWRPLMLFLMTVLGRESDTEALRAYQRTRWGQTKQAETCVVDLSGIPAKSFAAEADHEEYLKQRVWAIRRKMMLSGRPPKVVLMHGLAARAHWEEIAGAPLKPDTVVRVGSTLFVMTASPTVPGRKNADWEKLGLTVRRQIADGVRFVG